MFFATIEGAGQCVRANSLCGREGIVSETQNRLSSEIDFYKAHKHDWLQQHSGEYVVLKGNQVLGFHRQFNDAYLAGVRAWGPGVDFLVRQVLEFEPVFSVF
jgi:hypothetical protein